MLCSIIGVSRSGYYSWSSRKKNPNNELVLQIKSIYQESKGCYGVRRIWHTLRLQGVYCGRNKVLKIMKSLGIKAKSKRKFRSVVSSDHTLEAAANILNGDFSIRLQDHVWVTDITRLYIRNSILHLACVMDLGTRRIVGWSMDESPRAEIVVDALKMAIEQRRPKGTLLVHSDRGSQYLSKAYRNLIEKHGLTMSMSGKGNCYDNAAMESFFATLKTELISDKPWQTHEEARYRLYEYIELFYNRQRIHSSLGYISPVAYEASL